MGSTRVAENLEFERFHAHSACYLRLVGEICFQNAEDLFSAIIGLPTEAEQEMILCLAGVTRVDSTGLGVLMKINMGLKKSKRKLTLSAPNDVVHRTLTLARMDKVLPVKTGLEAVELTEDCEQMKNAVQSEAA